ncbi:MAG: hypothetical protein HY706_04970 [Candidatus Hydrogenedentes bacterium]|nr:hypothetical protein [Candidatus Hydrogenedentota bacterium]
MIKINLLPRHLRPIKRSPLPYLASFAVLVIALVAIALTFFTAYTRNRELQVSVAALDERLQKLKPVMEEWNRLEELKRELKDRIDTINEIVRDRIVWSRQLWLLSNLAPQNMWYTGITVESKAFKELAPELDSAGKAVIDAATGKPKTKETTVQRPVLKVSGYVGFAPDGTMEVNPFLQVAADDPEFSALFTYENQDVSVTKDLEGFPVKPFTFWYVIGPAKG